MILLTCRMTHLIYLQSIKFALVHAACMIACTLSKVSNWKSFINQYAGVGKVTAAEVVPPPFAAKLAFSEVHFHLLYNPRPSTRTHF